MADTSQPMEGSVRSADGTTIAYERSGTGPTLILVDAAGGYRGHSPHRALAEPLSAEVTVITYDRRGRGASTDTPPYAVEREVDDLEAMITEAGGIACLYGFSSGALLALHAAARGLAIPRLALFEPPIDTSEERPGESAFTRELAARVAENRWSAVEFFHDSIGVPPEFLAEMEPASKAAFERIAHTLVYDCMISDLTSLDLVASVAAPTLVLDSSGTTGELPDWATAIVAALPNGTHLSLPGEGHGVSTDVIAPVLVEFLQADATTRGGAPSTTR